METDEWRVAPPMNVSRYFHMCNTINDKTTGNQIVVVVGGVNDLDGKDVTLKSTEIFDGINWRMGPDLPKPMCCGQLVSTVDSAKLLWVGGGDIVESRQEMSNDIYELSENLDEWIKMPFTLTTGRSFFAAVDAPSLC